MRAKPRPAVGGVSLGVFNGAPEMGRGVRGEVVMSDKHRVIRKAGAGRGCKDVET